MARARRGCHLLCYTDGLKLVRARVLASKEWEQGMINSCVHARSAILVHATSCSVKHYTLPTRHVCLLPVLSEAEADAVILAGKKGLPSYLPQSSFMCLGAKRMRRCAKTRQPPMEQPTPTL